MRLRLWPERPRTSLKESTALYKPPSWIWWPLAERKRGKKENGRGSEKKSKGRKREENGEGRNKKGEGGIMCRYPTPCPLSSQAFWICCCCGYSAISATTSLLVYYYCSLLYIYCYLIFRSMHNYTIQ